MKLLDEGVEEVGNFATFERYEKPEPERYVPRDISGKGFWLDVVDNELAVILMVYILSIILVTYR